jgi:hypothetical protein
MSQLNRRNALTAVASLPVMAVPATITAAGSPDAELLALGREFDRLAQEWVAQRAIDSVRRAAFEVACERATGIAVRDAPVRAEADDRGELIGYWKLRSDFVTKHSDDPKVTAEHIQTEDAWDHIHGHLYPLVEDILSRKAHTIAGLRLQARAVSAVEFELWDSEEPDKFHEKEFIRAVCAFAGVTPLPEIRQGLGEVQS